MVVWKLALVPSRVNTYDLPRGAQGVAVGRCDGELWLWVLVDPAREKVPTRFVSVGTGDVLPPDASVDGYVHSYAAPDGDGGTYVQHVFRLP